MEKRNFFRFFFIGLFASVFLSCGGGDNDDDETSLLPPEMPEMSETTIWTGPKITFLKEGGTDPSLAENQDQITSAVSITRDNGGGQIYNIVSENSANKNLSPAGTLWAIGTTDNLQNLSFDRFRAAVGKPKDIVGTDLVLLLVEDNIAIDIKFTSWSQQEIGGFAYERSTNE